MISVSDEKGSVQSQRLPFNGGAPSQGLGGTRMRKKSTRINASSNIDDALLESYDQADSRESLCRKLDRMTNFIEFVENAHLGVYKTDPKGAFIYANKKIATIFGFSSPPAFIDAVPTIEMLYADINDRRNLIQHIDQNGFIENAEVAFKKPDGQMIWVNIRGRESVDQNGRKAYEGFLSDITDRKIALNALRESETRFRQLVTQASEAFFLHDYKGKIIDVNRQACVSLGFSREELLELNLTDIDIEIRDKKHRLKYWKKLAPYDYITFEGRHRRKDGGTFPVEVRLGRVDLDEGPVLLSFVRDISERLKKDEELQRAFNEIKTLKDQLEQENTYLRKKIELNYRHEQIIGESDSIKQILNLAEKVARQNTCVLITGETGTGKELLAHAIHNMSDRNNRPMIKVNCAALPATLIESELFGREKGAFTGALSRRTGRFEAAHNSTIFLDEIGDLPLELQAKLLRVLQEGQFERLGSSQTIDVDVRVVAATNQNLSEMIGDGKFRKDLYYRLNVFPLNVPPLRSRQTDIPLLVWAFVSEFSKSMGKQVSHISKPTMDQLVSYPWPGNVRELKNVIERAMIISNGDRLEIHGLESGADDIGLRADSEKTNTSPANDASWPANVRELKRVIEQAMTLDSNERTTPHGAATAADKPGADGPGRMKATLEAVEKNHILAVLKDTGWRVSGKSGAALILGLKPTTLEARMKKLGIKRPS